MTATKPKAIATAPKGAKGVGKRKKQRTKAGHPPGSAQQRIKLFVEALLSNGENVTQAAVAAGFSPKSAASQGSRLLKNVKVRQELDNRRTEVALKVGLTTERTLLEVARLAYSDPRKFYNADGSLKSILELDDDCAATIASVEWDEVKAEGQVIGLTRKLKQWDKNAALEKAMKFHGAYEKDNAQPNAAVAAALSEANKIDKLKAKFAQVLAK